ncbi:MAG: putative sterol 24-c-methyltransferase [Linnemannia gamsii]|nr:MAG: putative sterol 24-c-methyltransferase [Linnemannia gamsii]
MSKPTYEEDLQQSKALHGSTWEETEPPSSTSDLRKLQYVDSWKEDQIGGSDDVKANSLSAHTVIANSFYDIFTDFFEYEWGPSFHYCRFYPGKPFRQAIARYEHYLAAQMVIEPHFKILDAGCGVAGPACEIARFTGAHITGLNNNDYQITRAKQHRANAGLEEQLHFVKGDFMSLPFESKSFDACYAIEATFYAPSLEDVYSQVCRVLKPGGVFVCHEFALMDDYEPTNPEHLRIVRGIELGPMKIVMGYLQALGHAGFTIEKHENLAANDDKVPWYSPANTARDYLTFLGRNRVGRFVSETLLSVLEKLYLIPNGSTEACILLQLGIDSIVEGAILGIFTPMCLFIARKPFE